MGFRHHPAKQIHTNLAEAGYQITDAKVEIYQESDAQQQNN